MNINFIIQKRKIMKEKKVRQKGFLALLLVAIIVLGMPGMTVFATDYDMDIIRLNVGDTVNSTDRVCWGSGNITINFVVGSQTNSVSSQTYIAIPSDGWVVSNISGYIGGGTIYLQKASAPTIFSGAEGYYRSLRDLIAMINLPGGDTHGYGVGTALPYSVMKALEDNPEDTLVFECVYKNNKYTFTILGADVKGKITPEISWYGPYWLAQNFFETTVIEPIEPLVIPD